MFLPTTYVTALLLTILTMICWGSWANTQKMTGKWRFELFYFDYSFGVLLCALIAMMTFGYLNPNEITAIDSFSLAGYRKMAWGLAGGAVFNLANMLLVAAISIAGLSVAFPIGIGLALVIGVVWNYSLNPQGNAGLLFGGSALVLAATIVDGIAYRRYAREGRKPAATSPQQAASQASQPAAAVAAAPAAAPRQAPVSQSHQRRPGMRKAAAPAVGKATPTKGIVLSIVAGLLMGSFYPLVEMGKSGDIGLSAYAIAIVFAIAVFVTTIIYSLFFTLLPVYGEGVPWTDYFHGTARQHLLGIAGGCIWMAGAVANFAASSAPATVQVGPAVSYAMGQGATMISALWGLLVWKEFAGAGARVRMLLGAMLVLFVCGLVLVSIAPLFSHA
jgi:glucose uptake protein